MVRDAPLEPIVEADERATQLDETARRYEQLVSELNDHNHRYHVLDAPIIDDNAYDLLYRELVAIEEQHPELVSSLSPGINVSLSDE